jgi:hypothetical protein
MLLVWLESDHVLMSFQFSPPVARLPIPYPQGDFADSLLEKSFLSDLEQLSRLPFLLFPVVTVSSYDALAIAFYFTQIGDLAG